MPLKQIPFFENYNLRYDWAAFEEMCEALGASSFVDFGKVVENLGPKTLRILLWAGLLHQNPTLKKEDAKQIIAEYLETHSMEELVTTVVKALQEGNILGKSDQGEAKPKEKVAKL